MKAHRFVFASFCVFAPAALAQGTISIVAGNGSIFVSNGDGGKSASAGVYPNGVAQDKSGNLYIADEASGRIRKVDASTGIISTYAGGGGLGSIGDGGPATSAGFTFGASFHVGLAVDGDGNLYIADAADNRVRKVNPAGVITTVAGASSFGSPGF